MESRYTLAGLIIIAVAISFTLYGIITRSDTVVGISLSAIVMGTTVTVIGISYAEPAEDILKHIIDDLCTFSTRILEDMGIIGGHRLKICFKNKLAILSEKKLMCRDIPPGVGIVNGISYVGIPLDSIVKYLDQVFEGLDLVDMLKRIFIDVLGVCQGLNVLRDSNNVVVELVNLTEKGLSYLRTPINSLRLLLAIVVARGLGNDVEVVEEVLTRESYSMKFRY